MYKCFYHSFYNYILGLIVYLVYKFTVKSLFRLCFYITCINQICYSWDNDILTIFWHGLRVKIWLVHMKFFFQNTLMTWKHIWGRISSFEVHFHFSEFESETRLEIEPKLRERTRTLERVSFPPTHPLPPELSRSKTQMSLPPTHPLSSECRRSKTRVPLPPTHFRASF